MSQNQYSINKQILKLAGPNILSNISVPLLSTVDTLLMGRETIQHLGAIGVGTMIFNFIYWNFGFLRMGTTGLTAQAYGEKNDLLINQTLKRALILGFLIAVILIFMQTPIFWVSKWVFNMPDGQIDFIQTYYNIRILAAPATIGLYALIGWSFGMQNAILPLVLTILINLFNIIGNIYFVEVVGMDIDGVAYATVASQYCGFAIGLIVILWRYKPVLFSISWRKILEFESFKRFLVVNSHIFIRTVCLTFAFVYFYNRSAKYGEMVLAVNVVLLQFVSWLSYAVDGFGFAAESLAGKFFGEKNQKQFDLMVKSSFVWAFAFSALIAISFWMFNDILIRIFTDIKEVQEATFSFIPWLYLFPIAAFACYIYDGIFIGITATKPMRDLMIISLAIFISIELILGKYYENHGLWASFTFFMLTRGLLLGYVFPRFRKVV